MTRPNPLRVALATASVLAFVAGVLFLARLAAPDPFTLGGVLLSVPGAVLGIVAIGSLYEWIVHRYVYHAPFPLPVLEGIYEVHQRGHHWHRFPPDRYVESGPVERIPVLPADPLALCGTRTRRWTAWAGQYALYMAVGIPFAFVPAWLVTRNPLFTASAILSGVVVCYYFIRVHDVIHYPAGRLVERFAWFRFLDRHHYIHHIDTRANLNFLLPLCDLLFGTLRLELTPEEARRWPAFEEAKRLPDAPDGAVVAVASRAA